MNRLKGTRVYLSGAMSYCPDNGVQWRVELGSLLRNLGVKILDPTNKPIATESPEDRERWDRLRGEGKFGELAKEIKEIRCIDLRMVDISDFVIVNIDTSTYTVGTIEEITLANRQKKPIIIRVEQGKKNCPWWLFAMIPHQMIFSTWEEVRSYLYEVNNAAIIEHYKRWWFFNF